MKRDMPLIKTLNRMFVLYYKNVPIHVRDSVVHRMHLAIIAEEHAGREFEYAYIKEIMIPSWIVSYIRHNMSSYDHLLRSGVPKDVARQKTHKYCTDTFKWWNRK